MIATSPAWQGADVRTQGVRVLYNVTCAVLPLPPDNIIFCTEKALCSWMPFAVLRLASGFVVCRAAEHKTL
jgi:hypothetical protein